MRRAILSDIHSNLEAFEVVLKDIESKQIDEI
ncbi:MAG: YfcE family phosphodiesterase, partial [Planctomycetota bacterium]